MDTETPLRVLLLLIYNDTPIYNEMLNIQQKYIHLHPYIDAYFITFKEVQQSDTELVGDVLGLFISTL